MKVRVRVLAAAVVALTVAGPAVAAPDPARPDGNPVVLATSLAATV